MATVQDLPQIRGVKSIPVEEFYSSGHRTCQGCESALVMRLMIKAAGQRTIVLGSTGCMYVANTTYYRNINKTISKVIATNILCRIK